MCRERIEECLRQEENNPRVVRFEARQEEEATGLPQTVGATDSWSISPKDTLWLS